jgi:hypothetical protein
MRSSPYVLYGYGMVSVSLRIYYIKLNCIAIYENTDYIIKEALK